MANQIIIRRSAVPGKEPTKEELALGEFALNSADGKLYIKRNAAGVESIVDITENQTITLTGDVTGSGTTSINVTLPNVLTTPPGYYIAVTVDEKGRVISGSTTQPWDTITNVPDFVTQNGGPELSAIAAIGGPSTGFLKRDPANPARWYLDNTPYSPPITTMVGDVVNSVGAQLQGTDYFDIRLRATGVTAGTYGTTTSVPSLTVDDKGRITAASNLAIAAAQVAVTTTDGNATYYPTLVQADGAAQTIYADNVTTPFFYNPNLGSMTVPGALTVAGNFIVQGTQTTVNSATLVVNDKNLELGAVVLPTDLTAAGGGITLKGSTDKTLAWVSGTTAWTSSENFDLAAGKTYHIGGTQVLSSTALGSSVTSVGTITSGTWSGSFGAVSGANLTNLTAANLEGTIPATVLANSTVHLGTTAVALDRASGNLDLAGITSLALPGATSGTVTLTPAAVAGTTSLTLPATSGTLVTTGDVGTVTNTMLAGGISNSKLANSTIIVNGNAVSLGGSTTITATASSPLTIGAGLSGTSYDGSGPVTIAIDSTVALRADTLHLGTTAVALDRASGNLDLAGISSINTLTLPATSGAFVTTGDTGSVTNTMLAGSISNSKLANSTITLGSTPYALGATATTLAGLTSVSATTFTGALSGNASTAAALQTAHTIAATGDASWSVSFDGTATATSALTLAAVGTAGTYVTVTTDAKGRVTSGSTTQAWSTITGVPTTLSGYGITDALSLSGGTLTGPLTLSGAPTSDLHASTKKYVDDAISTISGAISYPVTSVAGRTGAITLAQADIAGLTTSSTPTFAGVNATTFTGDLTGSATSATTATNAVNVEVTATGANATYYPAILSAASGNLPVETHSTFTINPSTGALAAASFNGLTGLASATPAALGTAAVGTSTTAARADHVHAAPTNIANSALANSSLTLGSTTVSLGATATSLAGLTSVSATTFTGSLSGNASTATSASSATNATNAANVALTNTSAVGTYFFPMVSSSATSAGVPLLINSGLSFNPASGVVAAGTFGGNLSGNATTAGALQTARSITATGDGSWTVSFDGSTSVSAALTLATVSQGAGTSFVKLTLDAKGRVTGNSPVAGSDIDAALGYTPYDSTNPAGYISATPTALSVSGPITATGSDPITTAAAGLALGPSTRVSQLSASNAGSGPFTLDSFLTTDYHGCEYTVQVKQASASNYELVKLMLLHDGTTVYLSEYDRISTATEYVTFDASLAGGTVSLTYTQLSDVVITAVRTALK